ncbi:nuclear transport factor 2 family protein [Streptomyces sp. NPDC056910]|uniref:nuclear transport factor 2 family protein n=1 Tax=Streptomyces sp. NPDC056910 TaxID=3345964 RepID=UPI0036B37A62
MTDSQTIATQTEQTRQLVTEFYRIATGVGATMTLPELIHPDIVLEEPAFFFQHGIHRGIDAMGAISPIVGELLDRTSIQMKSIVADGDRAFAVFTVEMLDNHDQALIAEYWEVRDGKLALLRIFPHDPSPYMARQNRIVRAQADAIPTISLG